MDNQLQLFDHTIYVGSSAAKQLQNLDLTRYSKVFCLVDDNTYKYCIPKFKEYYSNSVSVIEIESGENHKTFETSIEIWRTLLNKGADRNSLLINLGGGVICDLGGFVAGNFKRGIDFINIPTTLLAMVDAAIGGKTGVNLDAVKNQIGGFDFPEAVFVLPEYLETLPKHELNQGYAEILKHALIADDILWQTLKSKQFDSDTKVELIIRAIRVKRNIVEQDPKEKGERKLLNFGHTIGHAIETWSYQENKKPLSHGESVAIGIITESFISYRKSFISFDELKEIVDAIYLYFKPVFISEEFFDHIIGLMHHDKKNTDGIINFTLLKHIGVGIINQHADFELIKEALDFYKTFPDRNYIAQQ